MCSMKFVKCVITDNVGIAVGILLAVLLYKVECTMQKLCTF